MRIGILTFHRAHNYGAMLQAYALKVVCSRFADAAFIDYWPEYHANEYRLSRYFRLAQQRWRGKIKTALLFALALPRLVSRRRHFSTFREAHLPLINGSGTQNSAMSGLLDVVLYGSDQIWRKQRCPGCAGLDFVYFGVNSFGSRHVSYAASMGELETDIDQWKSISEHLARFEKVSVREMDLQEALSQRGIESHLVVDPVLLLDRHEWEQGLGLAPPKSEDPYILFYHHNSSAIADDLVRELAVSKNYRVKTLRPKVDALNFGCGEEQTAGPLEFLRLFRDAQFVVSTSFHGAAFAIVFEKQFVALGMDGNSSRVRTLLATLGLTDRYIEGSSPRVDTEIDFREVRERVAEVRRMSIEFLQDALLRRV